MFLEAFEKYSRKTKMLTAPYDLPDLRGRHAYIQYSGDSACISATSCKMLGLTRKLGERELLQRSLLVMGPIPSGVSRNNRLTPDNMSSARAVKGCLMVFLPIQ